MAEIVAIWTPVVYYSSLLSVLAMPGTQAWMDWLLRRKLEAIASG